MCLLFQAIFANIKEKTVESQHDVILKIKLNWELRMF